MSRWWSEQIRIVLHPKQMALFRLSKGRAQRIIDKCIVPCSAVSHDEPAWINTVHALETALPDFCNHCGNATVVLSNHFVRYALISNAEQVANAHEERALIQHQFNQIYGAVATRWSLSISRVARPTWPRVACAVDQSLTDSLRELFQANKPALRSIQPYLMATFNQYRHRLHDSAWLALVEDGILCLARLENKQWYSIKCSKIGHNWRQDLAILLQRQAFVSGYSLVQTTKKSPIILFAPEYPEPIDITPENIADQAVDTYSFSLLDTALWPKPAVMEEPARVMALLG